MLKTKIIQKAFVQNKGKILLLKRSETDTRRPLQWDLPGGLLDEGEELYEGIVREVQEESGLKLEGPHVVYTQHGIRSWKDQQGKEHTTNNVWMYYAGEVTSQDVTLSYEHSDFVWVATDEAKDMIDYELQKEAIAYLIDNKLEL